MPLLILTVLIIACAVYYFISTQRDLVSSDERVKNALSQIGVQMETRWDAIVTLAKLTADYSKHEHDTLMSVIEERRFNTIGTTDEALQQQKEQRLIMSRLNAVLEQYPEIRASAIFDNTMDQLNEFENNVRESRQTYNDAATALNSIIRQWPSAFVAKILGFKPVKYLQTGDRKSSMPNL